MLVSSVISTTSSIFGVAAAGTLSQDALLAMEPAELIADADELIFAEDSPVRTLFADTTRPPVFRANNKSNPFGAEDDQMAARLAMATVQGLNNFFHGIEGWENKEAMMTIGFYPDALDLRDVHRALLNGNKGAEAPGSWYRLLARKGLHLSLGLQNIGVDLSKASTGENHLGKVPVQSVLLGHMERILGGESDESIAIKTKLALAEAKEAVLCIGERPGTERADRLAVIAEQFSLRTEMIDLVDARQRLEIANEPGSAIGTSPAEPDDMDAVHGFIRYLLARKFGAPVAASTAILYGGSVKYWNVRDFMSRPQIDGVLVGGAAQEFVKPSYSSEHPLPEAILQRLYGRGLLATDLLEEHPERDSFLSNMQRDGLGEIRGPKYGTSHMLLLTLAGIGALTTQDDTVAFGHDGI